MASINASIVDKWLEDDNLMLIAAWARDGYTMPVIADKIGVSYTTLKEWKKKYPEIAEALRVGKEMIDYKVENALLKSALGYTTKEIKVTIGRQVKNGREINLLKETTTKEIAPNVTACAMWLNNRQPDKWKRNRDKAIEIDDEDSNLSITIVRGPKDKEDNINNEIRIEPKKGKSSAKQSESSTEDSVQRAKVPAIKEESYDRDYWPDDWSEDDE